MASSDPIRQRELVARVGDPALLVQTLKDRIRVQNVRAFAEIQSDFLALLWAIDAFRVEQIVPPRAPGAPRGPGAESGEGLYRAKGNVFSDVVTLILGNKTSSELSARSAIQGFSQTHQIDIAWPDRLSKPLQDPLICCEAKLTGAPGFGSTPDRRGRADWSNRRKELKFQATDLKLYRQQSNTTIRNWDVWRRKAPPLVYTVWAARCVDAGEFRAMIDDAQALRDTYLDGIGIFGFIRDPAGDERYLPVLPVPSVAARVTSLDSVLDMIAAEIGTIMEENGNRVPAPVIPERFATAAGAIQDATEDAPL